MRLLRGSTKFAHKDSTNDSSACGTDFYLCYCELAFAHSNTDVIQFTLEHA
ncbi:MAG: hypothetical protein CBARDCOR_3737 [uncultured Caballeronia sp.]|nr:MAG: hypothetical protein CBARDCOR_3737 [uncultured Caballeronia sp.]